MEVIDGIATLYRPRRDTLRDTESGAINGGQILRCGLGIQKWVIILFTYNFIIFLGGIRWFHGCNMISQSNRVQKMGGLTSEIAVSVLTTNHWMNNLYWRMKLNTDWVEWVRSG